MAVILMITAMEATAQDWARWRGADNDGIVKGANVNLDWAEKKPALAWTFREAGMGYSSPTVVGTTLYCQGAMDSVGFAFALDTKTGNLKWKQELGREVVEDRENCPRGSITVDGDRLYLIRAIGQIVCLSAADGKVIWQKDFITDFGGKIMSKWGYSESPLIDGNVVICTPGGSQGAMVALDKDSGAVVWTSKEWTDEAGYSSPIVAEIDGVRQYIQQAAKGVAGISAKDGKLLWSVDVEGYRTAIIPTPIYQDNVVYVTASYNSSCNAIKLVKGSDTFEAEVVYSNKNMLNHHGGVVLMNGYIYGFSETSGWTCQDFKTGENVWSTGRTGEVTKFGKGATLAVNDRLILQEERSGTLTVVAASPDGWKEFGTLEIPERTQIPTTDNMVWAHPVVANGKLYVRDHDLLFCFDLK
ncbi:MAG: PQQ-like beta-propeller repeat protein [Bacteroidales bacterium]|nr:PQQ-like beta-propeller repeat protein [Bacteroidales bacterium]